MDQGRDGAGQRAAGKRTHPCVAASACNARGKKQRPVPLRGAGFLVHSPLPVFAEYTA